MAKKNQAKQTRLDERAARIKAQAAAEARTRNIIVAVFAVLILGGGGLIYFLNNPPGSGASSRVTPIPFGSPTAGPLGVAIADEGRQHIPACTPNYKHNPPSSGCHNATPTAWGVYGTQDTIDPTVFVHNLEHGGIVLVYKCSGSECDTFLKSTQDLFASLPKEPIFKEVKFVATPDQGIPMKAAVLAWGRELDLVDLNADMLQQVTDFYLKYVDKGPEQLG